jgi:RNA polymerase sigma-70 factor, ECF subfamily
MKNQSGRSLLEELIERHQRMIYAFAFSIAENREDAEDILQNVIFQISKNIPAIMINPDASRWIYRTTYNEAVTYLRRKRSQIRTFDGGSSSEGKYYPWLFVNRRKLPAEELLEDDLRERIDNVIRNIPIQYRMPLLLHQIEGLSLEKSSRILGLTVTTVRKRLLRSFSMIRSEIADYFNDRSSGRSGEKPPPACLSWQRFIRDYAEGKLNRNRTEDFERHIKDCGSCSRFLDSYQRAIRITGALECQDISQEFQEKIGAFFAKKSPGFKRPGGVRLKTAGTEKHAYA